jgi:hypothetical protein
MEPEILHGEFDTLLLDNSSGQEGEHGKCRASIFDIKNHLLECVSVFLISYFFLSSTIQLCVTQCSMTMSLYCMM